MIKTYISKSPMCLWYVIHVSPPGQIQIKKNIYVLISISAEEIVPMETGECSEEYPE